MGYSVTPLRLDQHRDALARLWAENMRNPAIAAAVPQRLRWLYEEAPLGPPSTVLALDDASGEVIGCGSYLPRALWVDGRRVGAGVLCDFAVAKAHRIAGAALTIQRALVETSRAAGLELLYGYPNKKSLAIFKRVGYQVLGETSTWVKPLRVGYKLRSVAPALVPFAWPMDAGLSLLDRLRALRAPAVTGEEVAAEGGAAEEALFEAERRRPGVVGEKTAAYLAWRYRDFTTAAHGTFRVHLRGEARALGWVSYAQEDGKAFLRELSLDGPGVHAEALLLALSAHLRRSGVDSLSVSCLAPAWLSAALGRAGFFLRPERRGVVVFPAGLPEELRASALDPGRWLMLEGDLDI
jgi:hypothetical protein